MTLFLKIVFGFISLCMIAVTIITSLQSNLFAVWPVIAKEPWVIATLQDFYFNILIIFTWVAYKERKMIPCALWFLAFVFLGSIATAFYVFLQLCKLKPGENPSAILTSRTG